MVLDLRYGIEPGIEPCGRIGIEPCGTEGYPYLACALLFQNIVVTFVDMNSITKIFK